MNPDPRPTYLTPPECAALLRVRESKVLGWIRSGRLPAIDISEGSRPRYRIRQTDLDAYLASRSVTPPPRPVRRERREIPKYV